LVKENAKLVIEIKNLESQKEKALRLMLQDDSMVAELKEHREKL
jgi:hypothetical protein